jgi:large subunit ribosomal protein L25
MSDLKLEAQPRELTGRKVSQLRRQGLVPVVVYGNVKQPVNLQVAERSLDRLMHAGGATQVVEVTVTDGAVHNVLVKEIHREPISHRTLHADFYAVNMLEKQHVTVPLHMVGKASGMAAGMMVFQAHEAVHVEALPADIPTAIEIDLTPLTLERHLTVADLPQLAGVSYMDDAHEILFSLIQTKEEVVDGEGAAAEPEVVKKGKQTDEE